MAFTWSCISLSVMAKTGWQNEKQRAAAVQTESMIRLNFFIFCIIISFSALLKRVCKHPSLRISDFVASSAQTQTAV